MKKSIYLILGLICSLSGFAQTPGTFNYQAVIRDASGGVLANQPVIIDLAIVKDSVDGIIMYEESWELETNALGLVNLEIGAKDIQSFKTINWMYGPFFISISVNNEFLGTSQLLSVPFAQLAQRVVEGGANDADADPTNEIQDISLSGNQLSISGGSTLTLPGVGETPTLTISGHSLSISNGNTVTLPDRYKDNDADPTNEIELPTQAAGDANKTLVADGTGSVSWQTISNASETDPVYLADPAASISDAGSGVVISGTERSKLSGIANGAEVNVQSDWSESDNSKDAYISNKPTLFSNSDETDPVFTAWDKDYTDIVNTPSIPTNVSDLTNDAGFISQDTTLDESEVDAMVANNGYLTSYTETDPVFTAWDKDYADIVNTPSIPTNVSDLTNDAGFISQDTTLDESEVDAMVANNGYLTSYTETDPVFTAWDKDYADIVNTPAIPTNVSDLTNDAGFISQDTTLDESEVDAMVANNGYLTSYTETDPVFTAWDKDYADIVNTPAIPTNVSDLTNDAGFITQDTTLDESEVDAMVANNGYLTSYTETDPVFTAWDKDYADIVNTPAIPTNVSDLINDAGFITQDTTLDESEVDAMVANNGYLTSYTETDPVFTAWDKDYADIVNTPTIPTNVSDLTNDAGFISQDTTLDETEVDAMVANNGYLTSYTETDPVFTAWDKDYADIVNTPAIPTNVSDLTNDAGFITQDTTLDETEVDAMVANNGYLTSYTETDPVFTAWDKDYTDIINTPTIPTNVSDLTNDAGFISQDTTLDETEVDAMVANNGYLTSYTETDPVFTAWDKDYTDIINTPTIPTNVSDLTNDAGFITQDTTLDESEVDAMVANNGYLTSYTETDPVFTAWDKDYADIVNTPTIPTNVSDLTNDAGFITQDTTLDESEVDAMVANNGYLTSYTETDPVFAAWDKDYADIINKPNIINSQWTTTGSDIYYNSGNVGIGTSTPQNKLVVGGDGWAQFISNTDGSNPSPSGGYNYGVYIGTNKSGGATEGNIAYHNYLTFAEWDGETYSETMRIDASGNVGIGTVSPVQRLSVVENASYLGINVRSNQMGGATFRNKTTTILEGSGANDSGHGNVAIKFHHNDESNLSGDLSFWTKDNSNNQYERMRIAYNGNVGIGTTTPFSKLSVVGGAFTTNSGLSNESTRPAVGTSRIAGEISGVGSSLGADDGFLRLSAGGGNNPAVKSFIDLSGYSTVTDMLNNITFGTAGTERMRIDNSGYVGIGTTAPQTLLHVSKSDAGVYDALTLNNTNNSVSGQGVRLRFQNSAYQTSTETNKFGYIEYGSESNYGEEGYLSFGTNNGLNAPAAERMRISSNGNVGIGTTAPTARLDLGLASVSTITSVLARNTDGDQNFKLASSVSTGTSLDSEFFRFGLYYNSTFNSGMGFLRGNAGDNGYLNFYTSGTESMCITANGNVGIGTSSPVAKLEIQASGADSYGGIRLKGFTTSTDVSYWSEGQFAMMLGGVYKNVISSSGVSYFNGGNVGVGTTSPTAPLHVASTTNGLGPSNSYFFNAGTEGSLNSYINNPLDNVSIYAAGSIVTGASMIAASDKRIKTDIENIHGSLDVIKKLRPVQYTKIDKFQHGNRLNYGFIAQEVEEVLPNAVNTSQGEIPVLKSFEKVNFEDGVTYTILIKNGDDIKEQKYTTADPRPEGEIIVKSKTIDDFKSITYDMIFTVAVDAIQEQQNEIEILQQEVKVLKAQNVALTQKTEAIDQLSAEVENLKKLIGVTGNQLTDNK